MTSAERAEYIRNKHLYIALYMTIPAKKNCSLMERIKGFFNECKR